MFKKTKNFILIIIAGGCVFQFQQLLLLLLFIPLGLLALVLFWLGVEGKTIEVLFYVGAALILLPLLILSVLDIILLIKSNKGKKKKRKKLI